MGKGRQQNQGGRQDITSYKEVLAQAHREGLKSIETRPLTVEFDESGEPLFATFHATVVTDKGTFTGTGDATRGNTGKSIVPHLIRMAETRAKARALKDAVNIATVTREELADAMSGAESGSDDAARKTPSGGSRGREKQARNASGRSQPDNVSQMRGGAKNATAPDPEKARKSDVEMLRWSTRQARGENGVSKLEEHVGKKLEDFSRDEVREWTERMEKSVEKNEKGEKAAQDG